jgi:hypothetical protein
MGMTRTIDVLLDARTLLARPNGWVQNAEILPMPDGSRAYCLQGAIEAADPGSGMGSPAWVRVQSLLEELIPVYNDAPGRQQSEVIETIDRAIEAEWRGDPIGVVLQEPPPVLGSMLEAMHAPPPEAA